ncbi:MAG: cytochrome C [Gammaproteobacteria bacterium HGW-Gammaproteobacteria-1]|jgi:mono/diheme cytochrome c family protein|nr:MAG: cytochrome C [Gammaproteobacteria bacterium HGW-Gammaproteobacteria-1]
MLIRHLHKTCCVVLVALALGLAPAAAPAQPWQIPKPSPGLTPNPAKGMAMYAQTCAACHGRDMRGTDQGPPFLHRVYEPSHHSDAAFQLAVRNGVRAHHWNFGDMAPLPELNPDDVAHIAAYIRMEQRRSGFR